MWNVAHKERHSFSQLFFFSFFFVCGSVLGICVGTRVSLCMNICVYACEGLCQEKRRAFAVQRQDGLPGSDWKLQEEKRTFSLAIWGWRDSVTCAFLNQSPCCALSIRSLLLPPRFYSSLQALLPKPWSREKSPGVTSYCQKHVPRISGRDLGLLQ